MRDIFFKVFYDNNNTKTFLALDVKGNVLGLACCWKGGDLNFVRPLYANDMEELSVTAKNPSQNHEAVKMMKETLLNDIKGMFLRSVQQECSKDLK